MKFSEILLAARGWLQQEGRLRYRSLKREFDLDDETLEDLKAELIEGQRVVADEDGKVLVWTGASSRDGAQRNPGTAPVAPDFIRATSWKP